MDFFSHVHFFIRVQVEMNLSSIACLQMRFPKLKIFEIFLQWPIFALFNICKCALRKFKLFESRKEETSRFHPLLSPNRIERQNSDLGRGLVHSVFGLGCHTFCWGWCLSEGVGVEVSLRWVVSL